MSISSVNGIPGNGYHAFPLDVSRDQINALLTRLMHERQFHPNVLFISTRLPETGRSDYTYFLQDDDDLWLTEGYPHPVSGERIKITGSEYLSPGHVVFARMEGASYEQ